MSITTRLIRLEVPATPRTSSMYWASAWSLVPRRSREVISRSCRRPLPAGPSGCPRIVPPATRARPRSHLLVAFRHTDDERHRADPALSLSTEFHNYGDVF